MQSDVEVLDDQRSGGAGDPPRRMPPARTSALGRGSARIRRLMVTYLGVGGVLLALVAYLTATQPAFATYRNMINILETNSVLLIVAVGMTFVVLSRGFDLSLGGILALTAVSLHHLLVVVELSPLLAMVLAVGVGTALGMANGVLIGVAGLSFIVVTLCTAALFRGVALVLTAGQTQALFDQNFLRTVGAGRVAGVPWPVIIALTVLVCGILVLRYTGFGRMLYAIGGNPEAARLAGINVTMIQVSVYAIAGGLTGLAAVLDSGRLAAASPTAGTGLELTAGAAVLLGGTTLFGGRGTLLGTLLGVMFLGVLANGLTLAGISAFWQGIVLGIVLILALLVDRLRSPRALTAV